MSNGGRTARKDNMKNPIKRLGALTVTGAILAASLVTGIALPASAQTEECVPREAYTETINHPAVGEPTITVDNPDYVPGTPEQTVADGYMKWNWTGGGKSEPSGPPPASGWHAVGKTSDTKGDTPGVIHKGKGKGSWFYFEPLTKVIPGTPAQGEPTITVVNPDYVPPKTETIEHEAVTCDTEQPEPPVTVNTCATFSSVHTTNLATWNTSETRATGHNELVEGGLHVWTEGATSTDKAAGYIGADFALRDAGSGFGITGSSASGGFPGLQMLVDLDADGDFEGYLVHEPVYGPDSLWLSANWGGADLSVAPSAVNGGGTGKGGHVNAWLAGYPDAKVSAIGYSLGSGVKGDLVIEKITVGCVVYTFDLPELPADRTVEGVFSTPVITCDNKVGDEITITREDTIYTYTRDENGQPVEHIETVSVNDVYIVTGADIEALECPVTPEPPVEEPEEPVTPTPEPEETVTPTPTPEASPTVTPTPAASADKLAQTGNDAGVWLVAGILGILLVGAGATLAIRRRNSRV